MSGVVVCSFYTADDYYRAHAESLRKNLENLGIEHVLEEVEKKEGEDWADICRKKIGFLAGVCESHPDKRVFWIDVDCKLLDLPEYVAGFTADILGFQRGFGSPLKIGYHRRTRFWEPCFFGIAPTPMGRKFIRDAYEYERSADIKATDDYFFEESWRANAGTLSFQMLPRTAVVAPEVGADTDARPFFSFGSSGNVAEFKGKVVQHTGDMDTVKIPLSVRVREAGRKAAKRAERALPARAAKTLRRVSDTAGVTGVLTGGSFGTAEATLGAASDSPHRQAILREILRHGQNGDVEALQDRAAALTRLGIPTTKERNAIRGAEAFAYYASRGQGSPLPMVWWARPFPGNFGDWLSPLIAAHYTERPITFLPPTAVSSKPNIVSIGSIGRFIKSNSVVVGTGISSLDVELVKKATYVSVRGPLTAQALKDSGGEDVDSFGDPGLLVSRVLPISRGETNGRIALVRHYTHIPIHLQLPSDVDELSVLRSHPDDIAEFLESLVKYDMVVTSAMHVMIVCHAYGIPVTLVTFEGFESSVHGTGIKYEDYSRGAGLQRVYEPINVPIDLREVDLRGMAIEEKVSDAKLDEIEAAMRRGLELLENETGA
ncbi:polysaccharide pyruvyl transferase family protein [Demequina activiva]|nr:polysaccharide pyruvyl transferase family protein [Demequina activiva]